MINIVATIPKSKFPNWQVAERVCVMCDGETDRGNGEWFWLINCQNLPTKIEVGQSVCFMVFDGQIRGYFDIVDTDLSENWRDRHDIGKERSTHCVVMANWHPIAPQPHTGFQGFRYTDLRP